jgi:hypothetical protein
MAATFVGTSLNAKILRSTSQNTETNGLVTLEETYTIKTSLAQSVIPRPDTRHSSFSSATTKYSTMFVETTSLKEELGGISTLTVQYSGLLSKSLPRPVIRAIAIEPTIEGEATYDIYKNYVGPFRFAGLDGDYAVKTENGPELQIQFVILSSETYLQRARSTSVDTTSGRIIIGDPVPAFINNTPILFSGKVIKDEVSGQINMGYVLMNEENFKRGNAIIITQIYRKVALRSKISPPPPRTYYYEEPAWWLQNRREGTAPGI